jgi:hypothetical protein
MATSRFDEFTKRIAGRMNRRVALTGGIGVSAGLLARITPVVHAQDATPVVEATPPAEKSVEVLFVQTFSSGSLVENGADGFTLTLEGSAGQTVYFSDRPERLVGKITDEAFLDDRAFDPSDPPNAAIVAGTAENEDILVVELTEPALDAANGTISYTARVLKGQPTGAELAALAARQTDDTMAESLGPVTLFIDQLACIMSGSPCTSSNDCCNGNCNPQINICAGDIGPPS